jgi:hypothetical protein
MDVTLIALSENRGSIPPPPFKNFEELAIISFIFPRPMLK